MSKLKKSLVALGFLAFCGGAGFFLMFVNRTHAIVARQMTAATQQAVARRNAEKTGDDKNAIETPESAEKAGGGSPLHVAAFLGQNTVAKMLIWQGSDVNAVDEKFGAAPLHAAAAAGHLDMVKLLVERGARVDPPASLAGPPVALSSDREMAEYFIEKGADVNAKSSSGWSALHYAALMGRLDVVELFIEKGLDVNGKGEDGVTPLHAAAGGGHKKIAELLLERGADVNAKESKEKTTPLDWATHQKHADVIALLKSKGAVESPRKPEAETGAP